jgi:hypothetical protein
MDFLSQTLKLTFPTAGNLPESDLAPEPLSPPKLFELHDIDVDVPPAWKAKPMPTMPPAVTEKPRMSAASLNELAINHDYKTLESVLPEYADRHKGEALARLIMQDPTGRDFEGDVHAGFLILRSAKDMQRMGEGVKWGSSFKSLPKALESVNQPLIREINTRTLCHFARVGNWESAGQWCWYLGKSGFLQQFDVDTGTSAGSPAPLVEAARSNHTKIVESLLEFARKEETRIDALVELAFAAVHARAIESSIATGRKIVAAFTMREDSLAKVRSQLEADELMVSDKVRDFLDEVSKT